MKQHKLKSIQFNSQEVLLDPVLQNRKFLNEVNKFSEKFS